MPSPLPFVANLRLVDHHCHGVAGRDLDRSAFESLLTEAKGPGPLGGTLFDSQLGFAVRRWCAPVLDLPPHAPADDYLARRADLGFAEVNRRFLREAGLAALCVDTGYPMDTLLTPGELGALAGATAHEIVRLEQVAEEVAESGTSAEGFAGAFRERLAGRAASAVGLKSVAAYRVGLDLPADRPGDAEVTAAAGRWLAAIEAGAPVRLADPTLQAFLVWCGVDLRRPIQFHVGYGDADLDLHRCDPLLLTGLLRAIEPTGTPIMLLHNYPFHRHAGYLAQVFPNVFVDVGLATHGVGHRAPALIAELLELAPFGKFLFSSDAYGLPELFHLGSLLFRRGLSELLRSGLDEGVWTEKDAERIARLAGGENARRVYGLEERH
ncbi:amidohydrolase family protein [Actinoallomurus iriomotensis]|uniref:Amidohydrolase n=1 Tax=Actinoallomurus iriomotensis TaxID=478107 RepID=A0A9W6SBV3_9ACTN|nr:amidohydrolase family protein [Actinoallomurus iriomotensis]GLY91039.1 amidohydrolase [Actinoallomurus iriomotensis]